ncbi:hypothetical protein MMC14_000601 [Varicellaria rhodocarpa]|nr:hypothetical protein [Varicellaria rhodocarpa]
MASIPSTPTTPSTPRTPRTPGFNTKSPTIKRILQESRELSLSPDPTLAAAPLDTNLFEWHFTLQGPPSTPYANGIYHGRIILPPTYPLCPPNFRFLTPSGRFEVNREICLSISGHHEETWQPAWGIRTALCAIRAFMSGEAKGQVGGLEMTEEGRKRLATESRTWKCSGCGGRTNEEVLKEVEEICDGQEERKEEVLPEGLRLAYREEIDSQPGTPTTSRAFDTPSTFPERNALQVPSSSTPSTGLISRSKPPPSPLRDTASASSSSAISSQQFHSTNVPQTLPASRTYLSPLPPSSASNLHSPAPRTNAPFQPSTPQTSTSTLRSPAVPPTPHVIPPTPTTLHRPLVTATTAVEPIPAWVDKAIVGLVVGLVVMVVRKVFV